MREYEEARRRRMLGGIVAALLAAVWLAGVFVVFSERASNPDFHSMPSGNYSDRERHG